MTEPVTKAPVTCTCGSTQFEEGFIDDVASGRVRWISGPMKLGLFGNAKRSGPNRAVLALRCGACSRLTLFAGGG